MNDEASNDETKTFTPASLPKLRTHVARVMVLYDVVELPEQCPACGAVFCDPPNGERTLKEVNLADTTFRGAMVARNLFEPDPHTRVEERETFFFPYRYECAGCGQLVAGGEVNVGGTVEAVEESPPEARRTRDLPTAPECAH